MKRILGFTLIELLIAIAVVAILVTIAYPSYQEQVRKARRADAAAGLLELSQFMERFYTVNHSYADAGGDPPTLPFSETPKDGNTKFYDLVVVSSDDSSFLLRATPKGAQSGDSRCGELRLNNLGTRCILAGAKCSNSNDAGVRADVSRCW